MTRLPKVTWTVLAAALLLIEQARAADLRGLPPAPELPTFHSWTGIYVGAQVGYGWGGGRVRDVTRPRFEAEALAGGVHAGFNYQIGAFVVGVEGDVEALGEDRGPGRLSRDWQGSARGRFGYAFDTLMVYGTGGAAFTRFDIRDATTTAETSRTGWTAGGGVSYAFTGHVVGSVEYRYTDYGRFAQLPASGSVFTQQPTTQSVRAAVSYRF